MKNNEEYLDEMRFLDQNGNEITKEFALERYWGTHHIMVTAAHRYCLGRRTYIVGLCVDWLLQNWDRIEPNTKILIRDETKEAIDQGNAGELCDIDEWRRLLKMTEEQ